MPSRRSRTLGLFLCASVVAHAGAVTLLPSYFRAAGPARASVLEVTLLPLQALPVSPVEPPLPEARSAVPPRVATRPPSQHVQESLARALTLPEQPQVPAESAMAAPAPRPDEVPAQSAPKTQVANAAPPVFNAAYLRNPAPRYPSAARRAGEQGTVTLRVMVTSDGRAARVDLERSSGSSHLDAAALEAVRDWRFSPARRGTEVMDEWVLVPIVFRLEGAS